MPPFALKPARAQLTSADGAKRLRSVPWVREQSLEGQLRRQPGSQRRRFPICRQANRELQKSQVDFLELAAGYLIRRACHRV